MTMKWPHSPLQDRTWKAACEDELRLGGVLIFLEEFNLVVCRKICYATEVVGKIEKWTVRSFSFALLRMLLNYVINFS